MVFAKYSGWMTRVQRYALVYLIAIALSESITVFLNPAAGLISYSLVMTALLIQTTLQSTLPVPASLNPLLITLLFPGIIRIVSLALPLAHIPLALRYLLTGVSLITAGLTALKVVGISRPEAGLVIRRLPVQSVILLTGILLGYLAGMLPLAVEPLTTPTPYDLVIAVLILIFAVGGGEELLFRGIMQRTAVVALGRPTGMIYIALIFSLMHLGFRSVPVLVFNFLLGLWFGIGVEWTGSILGVTLAHGLINIILLVILPHVR